MIVKADCINEQIIGLHSTYHCGVRICANTLKDPFSTLKSSASKKKKKKVSGREKTARFLAQLGLIPEAKEP